MRQSDSTQEFLASYLGDHGCAYICTRVRGQLSELLVQDQMGGQKTEMWCEKNVRLTHKASLLSL